MGAEACPARGSQSWGLKRSWCCHSSGGTVLPHHLARDGLEQRRPRPLSWRVFSAFRPTKSLWQFFCLRPRVCPVPLTRPVWGRIFGWRQSLVQATCSLPKLWIRQWLPFPSIWGDQHEWFGSRGQSSSHGSYGHAGYSHSSAGGYGGAPGQAGYGNGGSSRSYGHGGTSHRSSGGGAQYNAGGSSQRTSVAVAKPPGGGSSFSLGWG